MYVSQLIMLKKKKMKDSQLRLHTHNQIIQACFPERKTDLYRSSEREKQRTFSADAELLGVPRAHNPESFAGYFFK